VGNRRRSHTQTNIASNVGPQIDPKDVDYIEAQRGGYSAAYGDRSYGVFDVVPRTGFERDKERELYTSFGTFAQINDQMNFGGHSENFAYFASVNGNRSNYGLATPGPDVLHDRVWGPGGNGLFHYNSDANNQFRFISSLRCDDYQIPNDPGAEAAGIRDVERERDVLRLLLGARLSAEPAAHRFTVLPFQSCQLLGRSERFSCEHHTTPNLAVRRGPDRFEQTDRSAQCVSRSLPVRQ
jgi:hypothetical protein